VSAQAFPQDLESSVLLALQQKQCDRHERRQNENTNDDFRNLAIVSETNEMNLSTTEAQVFINDTSSKMGQLPRE